MALHQLAKSVFVGSAVASLGFFIFYNWKKQRFRYGWIKVGIVKKLHLFPLKSGHRVELDTAQCTKVGLKQPKNQRKLQLRDRELIVYGSSDHEFRTARTYPKMVLIKVSVYDRDHVAVSAPNMPTLLLKIPPDEPKLKIQIKCWYNEKITGFDCGDEAAAWMSKYIIGRGFGLRIAHYNARYQRNITKPFHKLIAYYENLSSDATGQFSDLASVSLVNQKSVDDLNKKLSNSTITSNNFRANIIIDCPDLPPYCEDDWEWLQIGNGVVLRNVKECTRCSMVTISQESGLRNPNSEPLRTLQMYRMSPGPEKAPVMGVYLEVIATGRLSVGDPVYAISKSEKNGIYNLIKKVILDIKNMISIK